MRTTALKKFNKIQNLTTPTPKYLASRSKLTGVQKKEANMAQPRVEKIHGWGLGSVVKCLPRICEDLVSILRYRRKRGGVGNVYKARDLICRLA